jgi:hypothetical protein
VLKLGSWLIQHRATLPATTPLSRHNSTTGLNHRTESLEEAIAFDAEQAKVLERVHAAEAAALIMRQVRDESAVFAAWVGVGKE